MMAKMRQFLVGFLVCALLLGAYPVSAYGTELPPSTEEEKWVVVLDPGHGGADGGASRTINGVTYVERDLVLSIALYCKAELEKYDNVVVYMTRTDNVSPSMEREQRAYYAASVGADVLVSFHLNATSESLNYAQTGAEVYYPNSNYKPDISQAGLHMSQNILWELQGLGIANNGALNRYTEDGSLYPDGSKGDYLGINYWSKMYGFPGILIEHAYINNPFDVVNFLSTEQLLMNIGAADARGIMNSLNSGQFTYEKGFAGRWLQSANGKWWFQYATGGWPAEQWLDIWGKWYYFDQDGYMAYGWRHINGEWYFLGDPDDGAMKTGWQKIGASWYYLGKANDGAMKTGWQYINNKWYYMSESGAMCYGWKHIDGEWYYLGESDDGAMKTGWQKIDGVWYYMYEDGSMAYNTWVGKYYVNNTGAWVSSR